MEIPIGELARLTEVKVPTIRYYEEIGLLEAPTRTSGKQRRYTDLDVERLQFIRRARALGFEVEEIRQLLHVDSGQVTFEADVVLRARKLAVDEKIEALRSLSAELQRQLTVPKLVGQGRLRKLFGSSS